jgi:MOSC domain-containing protein YiiM
MKPPLLIGRIASLHLHSREPGEAFQNVSEFELIAAKGVAGNPRYFGRPTRRQVTLMEREQIARHAAALGLETILPGQVRSNIETSGIDLISLIGHQVDVGEATVLFYAPRTPCYKMDALCQGLRALMEQNRQGVLGQVMRSGRVRVGDTIKLANSPVIA